MPIDIVKLNHNVFFLYFCADKIYLQAGGNYAKSIG